MKELYQQIRVLGCYGATLVGWKRIPVILITREEYADEMKFDADIRSLF